MKEKSKVWFKLSYVLIVIAIIFLVLFPVFLPMLVYNANILPNVPGDANVWMGFWASYSGAIITAIVAIISWFGNEKIEKLDSTLKREQRQYLLSMIGTNLRLKDTYIIAIPLLDVADYTKNIDDRKIGYKIILEFENVSNRVIEKILVKGIDIELEGEQIQIEEKNIESSFRLQGNTPIVEILLKMDTGHPIERKFTQFYFYYSQFPIEGNKLKLTANIDVELQKSRILIEEDKDRITNMQLAMNFKMEPAVEKRYDSNKVNITHYNLVEIEKKDEADKTGKGK